MAHWQMEPDASTIKNSYDICRTPEKGKFQGIFTSIHVMGTPVHYYAGRTIPHEVKGHCVPCEAGRSYRWMAYFGAIDLSTGEHVIFEVTAKIHGQIREYDNAKGGLRGIRFVSSRPSGRINGRIQFLFHKQPRQVDDVPDVPDVVKIMDNVWLRSLDVIAPENRRVRLETPANGSCVVETPRPR